MGETLEEFEGLDHELLSLPFHHRWETIGARQESATRQTETMPQDANGPRMFSRLNCSFKLRYAESSGVVVADDRPLAFLKTLQRNRRHESGTPDRLMKKSKSETTCRPSLGKRTDRVNPLKDVSLGLEALRTGDKLKLKNAKASRLSRMLLMDTDDQQSPTVEELRAKRRQQKDTLGQRVALTEFKRWCVADFGSLEEAWRCVDPEGTGTVAKSKFVTAFQDREYPTGDLGIKNVFFFLDADDDDIVADKDFHGRLDDVVVGQTKFASPIAEATQGNSSLMDPVEACAVAETGAPVVVAQARLIERIREHDPVVAQFIEYMVSSFHTLRMAFRRMDVNNSGSISKAEFQDTLRTMHSNTGARPIQEHLKSLFNFFDVMSSGYFTLDEFLHNVKSDEPLVARLRENLCDLPSSQHRNATELDSTVIDELRRAFKVNDRHAKITLRQFVDAMTRLRYVDWHVKDLWERLDKDNSQELTLSEFTAFLLKDNTPPRTANPRLRGSLVPLGSEERRKKVEKGHVASSESVKLGMSSKTFHARSKPKHRFPSAAWQSATPWCLDGSVNRPDYLGIVQAGLKRGCSELRQRGQHVLAFSSEPSVDLCGLPCALDSSEIIGMSCVQDM